MTKRESIIATVALSAAVFLAPTFGALAAGEAKAMHGGIVAKVNEITYELLHKDGAVSIFVSDHGKPVATRGATGKLTAMTGTEKTEAPLEPAGDNRLNAKGSIKLAPGSKVVASIQLDGKKPASVRFAVK